MKIDPAISEDMLILCLFLQDRGIEVKFIEKSIVHSVFDPNEMEILIGCKRAKQLNLLYTLLHEAGHASFYYETESEVADYHWTLFPGKKPESRNKDLIDDTIFEEYAAWQRGLEIAVNLELNIDIRSYRACSKKCLSTYRLWALGKRLKGFSSWMLVFLFAVLCMGILLY